MLTPDPAVAQLKTELQQHCAAVSNLANAAILRANGNRGAVAQQVLSGSANGYQVNVIQGHRSFDEPGLDLPFRAVECARNNHTLTVNFQSAGNFTALLDGRMFLCTVMNEPKDPGEFRLVTHAVVGVLGVLREILDRDAKSNGEILKPVPPSARGDFETPRPESKEREPFERNLAAVLAIAN